MPGCNQPMQVWVPKGYSYKEITTRCGSTSISGGVNLCETCLEKLAKQYPQGWRNVPGDVCKHGNYVGDAGGPDYLCPQCETE